MTYVVAVISDSRIKYVSEISGWTVRVSPESSEAIRFDDRPAYCFVHQGFVLTEDEVKIYEVMYG